MPPKTPGKEVPLGMHISITGLKPRGFWSYVAFWRLAIPSFTEAQKAEGNLHCAVKRIQGYQCTLTAWESVDHMRRYLGSGVHRKAMQHFSTIATGKTWGYASDTVPTWDEAFALLQAHGREHN